MCFLSTWVTSLSFRVSRCVLTWSPQTSPPGTCCPLSPSLHVPIQLCYTKETGQPGDSLFPISTFSIPNKMELKGGENKPKENSTRWPQVCTHMKHGPTWVISPQEGHPSGQPSTVNISLAFDGTKGPTGSDQENPMSSLLNIHTNPMSCKNHLFPICIFSCVSATSRTLLN